jgi:hypothetical protein
MILWYEGKVGFVVDDLSRVKASSRRNGDGRWLISLLEGDLNILGGISHASEGLRRTYTCS